MTATEVIVALALGLIVIVGLGFLVWTWIIRGGGQANEQYCKTQAFTYCTRARVRAFDESFSDKNPECSDFTWTNTVEKDGRGGYCDEILGGGSVTTSST